MQLIRTVEDALNLKKGETGVYHTGHLASAVSHNKALEEIQKHIFDECYEIDESVPAEPKTVWRKNPMYDLVQAVSAIKVMGVQKSFDYMMTRRG